MDQCVCHTYKAEPFQLSSSQCTIWWPLEQPTHPVHIPEALFPIKTLLHAPKASILHLYPRDIVTPCVEIGGGRGPGAGCSHPIEIVLANEKTGQLPECSHVVGLEHLTLGQTYHTHTHIYSQGRRNEKITCTAM